MTIIKIKNNRCKNYNAFLYLRVGKESITSYDDFECQSRAFNYTYDKYYDDPAKMKAAVSRYQSKSVGGE